MRRISQHHDLTVLGLQKSILEGAGIASFVLNGNTWWLANGGVSLLLLLLGKTEHVQNPLLAPVLCLADDEDFEEAVAVLQAHQAHMRETADWFCPRCSQTVPGNFEVCWQCDTEATRCQE